MTAIKYNMGFVLLLFASIFFVTLVAYDAWIFLQMEKVINEL